MTLTWQLHAINTIKHRIRDAMEAINIDCNGLPLYLYANAMMQKNNFDPITGNPPAAVTLGTKLEKLEDAKTYLAQAINACGGLITENTPFRDYPGQIRLCDGMAGANWSAVGGVDQAIQGAIYATDGNIYILGSSKVWRTADLQTFTELTLIGEITGGMLGGICETLGQKIVIGDDRYVFVKPAGSDTFTKTSMSRGGNYYWGAQPISGRPDRARVWLHSRSNIGNAGTVRSMDVDTQQDNYGTFALHPAGLFGFAGERGILTDDADYERWVLTGNRNSGYYVITLKFFWALVPLGMPEHTVASEYGYATGAFNSAQARLAKSPNGRIWAAGYANSQLFGHYSDAHGLAFTAPVFTSINARPTAMTALRSTWLLVGSNGAIRRVRKNFQAIETVATVNGSPTEFVHLPDGRILCCTDSTSGTNLYITEA